MDYIQKGVKEFHDTFGMPSREIPTGVLTWRAATRRINLIKEELEEFRDALVLEDIVAIADALGDLIYVIYGAAVELGIDMEEINKEIHRSNMTKFGGTFDKVGKLIKPDDYSSPNLLPIIEQQINK